MANRRDVFQEKLMRRLYPVLPKPEKSPAASNDSGAVPEKTCAKLKTVREKVTAGDAGGSMPAQRRLYTALPPPEDYRPADGGSAALSEPEGTSNEGVPAGETQRESSPEPSDGAHRRRRRKRRRRAAAEAEPRDLGGAGEDQGRTDNGDSNVSRNKRRKEKKKRRKERLFSLGLIPSAGAVEFTYQPGLAEDEVEDETERQRKTLELQDFIQTTWETCCSDNGASECARVTAAVMQGMTARLGPGSGPGSDPLPDLPRLLRLRALVLQRDADGLKGALEEFWRESAMDPAETSAICSLFRYWLTEILPLQRDQS
ncbi:hypothetical protein GJAV_G00022560 [Gymnothorax javanicus]|nr:hypothetical protein GJAV_G00022560 [Gymnothorax javanicus]